jgi:hypothetical protein
VQNTDNLTECFGRKISFKQICQEFRANDYITTPVKTFTSWTHPSGRRLKRRVYFLCLTVQIDWKFVMTPLAKRAMNQTKYLWRMYQFDLLPDGNPLPQRWNFTAAINLYNKHLTSVLNRSVIYGTLSLLSCYEYYMGIPCLCCQSSWLQIQKSGFDSQRYQIFWEVVSLERGPLRLVSTIEELLGRKSIGSGIENQEYRRRGSATITTWHASIRKGWNKLRRQAAVARSV